MDVNRINELGFEKISKWHMLVLEASFSSWWQFVIGIQCYMVFLISTFSFAYRISTSNMIIIRYLTDFCYIIEIVLTVSYLRNPKISKLRFAKTRGWFFIILDILSVIPFELLFQFHFITVQKSAIIHYALLQNRILRIYRVFLLVMFYEIIVRKPLQYALLLFVKFTFIFVLLGHVMTCLWVQFDHSVECDSIKLNCFVWYEANMMDLVLLNWSGSVNTFRGREERLIAAVAILLGVIFVYWYFFPSIFYISMKLNYKKSLFYQDFQILKTFCNNTIRNPKLRKQILHRFNEVWSKGKSEKNIDNLMKNVPLALKKKISTDIYWDAFRHSEFFRDISRSCKRSLSLLMKTEYYHSGEIIFRKGEEKLKMLYIVQGMLQIMAEENEESPIVSFSSGTVFGEWSLFFYFPSHAIVKCRTYCELQTLSMETIALVLKDYPKDKQLVLSRLYDRLAMAKYTQWRKYKFTEEQKLEMMSADNPPLEDCVKWLKTQWRALWGRQKRHELVLKAIESGTRLRSWYKPVTPEIKIDYISNYLDLYALSNDFERKVDVVCLQPNCPWFIDPSSQFLRIWYYIVMVTSIFPALVYPLCTAWMTTFPRWIYELSFAVTLINIIDVSLKLFTAVKTKYTTITQFSAVLRHSLQKPTFYFDIIAAIPFQMYIEGQMDFDVAKSHEIGLFLYPSIVKSYIVLSLRVPLGYFIDLITVLKNCAIYFLLLYWYAAIVQMLSLQTDIHLHHHLHLNTSGKDSNYLILFYESVFSALVVAISIPNFISHDDSSLILAFTSCAKYFFFLTMGYLLSEFYGVLIIKVYAFETYLVLVKRVSNFLKSVFLSAETMEQILKCVTFHWDYDRGDYLFSKVSIVKGVPPNVRKIIHSETSLKTLRSCLLFEQESTEFLNEVIESSFFIAAPRGSVLVTFGQRSHVICVIHRGYCQMNSFLINDITAEVGAAVQIGFGYSFPLLSSLCNTPSPVSVIAITDCEVLMISLDDLLNIMFKHKIFKDVVDVMKELKIEEKLREVTPGLVKVKMNPSPPKLSASVLREFFLKKGLFWRALSFICPTKNIFTITFFKKLDFICISFVIVKCFVWPACFGALVYQAHYLMPIFSFGTVLTFTYMALRFFMPYYNSKGLLVTHPVYTSIHYLKTAFLLDFVRFFPTYQIYQYGFASHGEKPSVAVVTFKFIQLHFHLIPIAGFLNFYKQVVGSTLVIRMLKICFCFTISVNALVNFVLFAKLDWVYNELNHIVNFTTVKADFPMNNFLRDTESIFDYYIFTTYWMLGCMTTNEFPEQDYHGDEILFLYVLGFIGTLISLYLYVWISSNSIFGNISGTIYQEKVLSFMNYLNYEKADDKLIEYASYFYKYEWSQTQGEALMVLYEQLPSFLYEELVYPLFRPTLAKNKLFANADEGFFKILSTGVKSVFFNRGSVIIFRDEVQSNIFFVHKGKCFVYDWFLVLDNGSLVGDIQRTGLMQNKVYALTHVEMLKISCTNFFMILNNFGDLEAKFLYGTKNAENFIKSDIVRVGHQLRPVDSKDVLQAFCLDKKEVSYKDESVFEDPVDMSRQMVRSLKFERKKKRRLWIIYPGTRKMKAYLTLYFIATVLTLVIIPFFMSFGGFTVVAFTVIGIIDVLWLIVIALTFLVGVQDSQKGDVITDFKIIAKTYLKRIDGLFLHLVTVIPFEFIIIALAGGLKYTDPEEVSWARAVRLFRVVCFIRYMNVDNESFTKNIYLYNMNIILIFALFLFFSSFMYVDLAVQAQLVRTRNPWEIGVKQIYAFFLAFEFVINYFASANVFIIFPDTKKQILYCIGSSIFHIFMKGILISKVLSFLYVNGLATTYYKSQVIEMESYLTEKDTSQSIIKEVFNYKTNLLLLSRSENMPSLLKKAPMSLKIMVMRDIYIQHLLNCPLFVELDRKFLDQLIGRAYREFYFPGQEIVEQGDVDHSIYFIHSGEVYVINPTKERAYIEHVVRKMYAGDFFGGPQCLWFPVAHFFTYRARTVVEVVVIHADDWMDLRRCFPKISKTVLERVKKMG